MGAFAALIDDTELMTRVKQGDDSSFDLLLGRHRASVVRYLYRMVQNQAVAEELAQETFLRVYRSRTTYEPSAKFTTWLFRIATHLALNSLRNGRREDAGRLENGSGDLTADDVPDPSPTAEQSLVHRAKVEEVRQAIAALPAKQRAAVLMHKYEEMDYCHIARVLNCSEPALKSLLFRAYETLRARLAHMSGAGGGLR